MFGGRAMILTAASYASFSSEQIAETTTWARRNGLDPMNVAATDAAPVIEIVGDVIRYREFVRTDSGAIQLCPDGKAVLRARTAPLVVPWPSSLAGLVIHSI
jgi:hypothetical protein